jgi:hypothetical protein
LVGVYTVNLVSTILGEVQLLQIDQTADPPVFQLTVETRRRSNGAKYVTKEEVRFADHFSEFIFGWFTASHLRDWTPLSERHPDVRRRTRPARLKSYLNELCLYAPAADALAAPDLDFLIEHLTEDARRPLGDGVMQHEFHNDYGRIRVTTDALDEEGGVSAWWLHADSEEGLFQLAHGVLCCVNLRHELKHWTKTSQPVMERLHELRSR